MGTWVFAILALLLAALVLVSKMYCVEEREDMPLVVVFLIECAATVWGFYTLLLYAASHL